MSDSLDEKLQKIRTATREANEVLAELKLTLKAVHKEHVVIEQMILNGFEAMIQDQVADSLKQYQSTIDQAIKDATQAVFDRFDQLTAVMLGETKQYKRSGKMSIPEMIQKKAELNDDSS